ncbi:MAG: phosphomannomutase/phosphoglucomutase [Deltaproteobacteria bacterium]|nr:phosphomannomutase/phosphoglucomutase [Deltaproteobacteria bacterium]
MISHIFREYDIRGIFPDELNEKSVYRLGRAFGTYFHEKGAHRISLGRDCRLSSPDLAVWLSRGLMASGMTIVDVGMVPTPILYYTLHHLPLEGGIQITGSHNPPDFNGFKICLGHASVYGEEIQAIRKIAESEKFITAQGALEKSRVDKSYIQHMVQNIHPGPRAVKAVVDGGNGVAGPPALRIYRRLGFNIHPIFCEPDGRFPHHHPDPTIPDNLQSLTETVHKEKADLGMAFDGDGDRIGVVDPEGGIIPADHLMMIFARKLLMQHKGAKIIGDIKCTQALFDDIKAHGGNPIMWKSGHAITKSKMQEEGALLAGELSGHIFFKDRYFGYDDAIYAGARLLEILSRTPEGLMSLIKGLPNLVNTPEIRLDCPETEKFKIVTTIADQFRKEHPVIDLDGARILLGGGWGLIRASNTQPALVLRFEAENEKRLEEIKNQFMEKVRKLI